MMKAELIGPWFGMVQDFERFSAQFGSAAKAAIAQEAHHWAKEVKKGIRSQTSASLASPPWPPLAGSTLQKKKPKTKMLIDTGTLVRNIVAEKVADWRWIIGVKRGAKTSDGSSLVNIGAVHELGATSSAGNTTVVIPARPFLAPVVNKLKEDLDDRIMARFEREVVKRIPRMQLRKFL